MSFCYFPFKTSFCSDIFPILSHLTLPVQYLVALAYSFLTDVISLGYYFSIYDTASINTSEGLCRPCDVIGGTHIS